MEQHKHQEFHKGEEKRQTVTFRRYRPTTIQELYGDREHGEIASERSCNLFDRFVEELPEGLESNDLIMPVKQWARMVNERIIAESHGNGMATTITGLLLYYGQAYILNCGDLRTYRFRYDNFKQLSRDHSETTTIMYNCLGIQGSFIDITPTKVIEGDRFLRCSDGCQIMCLRRKYNKISRRHRPCLMPPLPQVRLTM